jgi:hypothetical protein
MIGGTPAQSILIEANAFDISLDAAVWAEDSDIIVARADGTRQRVAIKGLFSIGRPSIAPDGQRLVVQALEQPFASGVTPPAVPGIAQLFNVYLVDLRSGEWRRVGAVPTSASTQSELPVFFPNGDRVAYWTTENECLVIRVADATSLAELLTIRDHGTTGCYQPRRGILDGARFHFAVSRDSSRILISGQLQVFDTKTGALMVDLHQRAFEGLAAAGYRPDARFPGQQNAGTFPLSSSFSPDGGQIVFDGAVERDGAYGAILCQINTDGSGFTVLRSPVPVPSPQFTNNLNFSALWPQWR